MLREKGPGEFRRVFDQNTLDRFGDLLDLTPEQKAAVADPDQPLVLTQKQYERLRAEIC